ncbi:serine/threonine protein kinase [Myxococcota bacterium]|nr:serine/threonine protein kinase [Myxococcota bacterium]MBU1380169.1 serine/threonine protein kinase [Myxococcota bacterium]MBU1497319.1 serine/threonine protein kinase [Myxococcota bacterium]
MENKVSNQSNGTVLPPGGVPLPGNIKSQDPISNARTIIENTEDNDGIEHARTVHVGNTPVDSSSPPIRISGEFAAKTRGQTVYTVLPRASLENGEVKWIHTEKTRLEILKTIGEGGAGQVFIAMDHDIGRRVAVKKIKSDVKSPVMLMRFVEEIRTVGRLEHPNIIPVHDVGVDEDGDYYFVMKYIEGETLEDIIEKLRSGDKKYHQHYTFERRVEIFRGILEALRYAHSEGIIHRDIKPANVMVGPFGEVMLMDWGIAKSISDDVSLSDTLIPDDKSNDSKNFWRTGAGGLIGTPAYMSPEQSRGEKLDVRSDTYSLNVLFYEMLTLSHYLEDRDTLLDILEGVQNFEPGFMAYSRSKVQPPVPMELVWFVRKGIKKNPVERFQTVNEMIQRLDLRAQGIIPIQCHITLMKRFTQGILGFTDRHPMVATAGLMSTIGLGIFGLVRIIL